MRHALLLLAGFGACAWVTDACAEDGFFLSAEVSHRSVNASVTGALQSLLQPATPISFAQSDWADGARFSFALGHEWRVSDIVFASVKGQFGVGVVDQRLAPVTSNLSVDQTVNTCFPPPPGAPPGTPCVSFGSSTRSFAESQSLAMRFEDRMDASLNLEAGFEWRRVRVTISGGASMDSVRLHYGLPAVNTSVGPVPPVVTVGLPPLPTAVSSMPASTQLPAEFGVFKKSLTGWNAGVDLSIRLSRHLSSGLSYHHVDYGGASFGDTTRLRDVRLDTSAHELSLAARWTF